MIKKIFALVILAGVCNAFPHEDETTNMPQPEGPVGPERSPVSPEIGSDDSVQGPFDPEKGPFTAEIAIFPTEAPGDIPQPEDGPKEDSDLKTDATFWWPFYRSWYPSYRTYWSYPYYRYYRPRTYYRYYYW